MLSSSLNIQAHIRCNRKGQSKSAQSDVQAIAYSQRAMIHQDQRFPLLRNTWRPPLPALRWKHLRIGAVEDTGKLVFGDTSLQQQFLKGPANSDHMMSKSHRKTLLQDSYARHKFPLTPFCLA